MLSKNVLRKYSYFGISKTAYIFTSVLLFGRVLGALKFYRVFVPAIEPKNHRPSASPFVHASGKFLVVQKISLSIKNVSNHPPFCFTLLVMNKR
jgi:hypothetical protein